MGRTMSVMVLIAGTTAFVELSRSQQADSTPTVSEKLWAAISGIEGVEMTEVRKIGHEEEIRALLLDILNPATGQLWGRGFRKAESITAAIFTLGEFRERKALPRLKEILEEEKTDVTKAAAIQALGKIDADGVKEILYPMLLAVRPHESSRKFVLITALSQCHDRLMYDKLQLYIRGEPGPRKKHYEELLLNMRKRLAESQ